MLINLRFPYVFVPLLQRGHVYPPNSRNLLQVKYSKDLTKDQKLIHTLMGNDVSLRKDFIISNAINVQNLDI